MGHRADEVKVGIFVVLTLVLLFLTVITVSRYNPFRTQTHAYRVRFGYVGGLAEGSPVRLGGLTVGRVENIRVISNGESTIEVLLSVGLDTPIRRDSEAAITSLGLLGDNYVEISLGSPTQPLLPPGEFLKEKKYPALPEIFARMELVMGDAQKLIRDLNLQINRISDKADVLLTDIDKTFADANQRRLNSILAETDELIKQASPKVNDTLSNIQTASKQLEPMLERVNATVGKVDALLVHLDETVMENRPAIRKSLQDLDQTLLETRSAVIQMRSMIQYNRANLDILIENLAASSQNIREFTDTIRQYPFSLIRMPAKESRVPPEIRK